jgi:hypothetical protein
MVWRFAVALLFAGSAVYAATLTWENARSQEIALAARQLEKSRTAYTEAQLDELVASDGMTLAMQSCRSDILRPALSVQLVSASLRNAGADFDAWSQTMAGAEAFLTHMVRCMPSEGNAWVREAMISRAIAEAPTVLSEKIAIAAALSPNEYIQLQARSAFWLRASQATIDASQDTLSSDLSTILTYGDDRLMTPLLANPPKTLTATLAAEQARLPAERRKRIEDLRGRIADTLGLKLTTH